MTDHSQKIQHFLRLSQKARAYRELGYIRSNGHRVERAAWLEACAMHKIQALCARERADTAGTLH